MTDVTGKVWLMERGWGGGWGGGPSGLSWDPRRSLPLASLLVSVTHCSCPQIDQMFAAFPPDVTGNLDYKNLVHIITHGEEKD